MRLAQERRKASKDFMAIKQIKGTNEDVIREQEMIFIVGKNISHKIEKPKNNKGGWRTI